MSEIPEFWRTEVYHPLFVHFPIALLLLGTLFKISGLWSKGQFLSLPGIIILALGVIGGWIAIYTGDLADGIVSRTLCDPTILKDHENASYTTMWLFSCVLFVDLLYQLNLISFKSKLIEILVIITLLVGSGLLMYTGHLGATLVYQQAAGVNKPNPDCSGFN
tara:strand:+ start:1032 stop:1520 length:489 start_codon:yes stop_codon:yes gene_type:complete